MARESKVNRKIDYNGPVATRLRELIAKWAKNVEISESDVIGKLAEGIGASRQAISQYKNGVIIPNTEKLSQIADFFKVSTDYLLKKTNVPTPDANKRAFCEATHLSSDSVDILSSLDAARVNTVEIDGIEIKEFGYGRSTRLLLNKIIEHPDFYKMLNSYNILSHLDDIKNSDDVKVTTVLTRKQAYRFFLQDAMDIYRKILEEAFPLPENSEANNGEYYKTNQ